ncbi:hypothetical protein EYF80_000346 [Liparis tanakae]|uniref:Uncharacterized protein n=1 Tax=Liparis tanakae TaxID=230148 RepID=A0A4Z2JIU5_9TELE|nr:hypothetical protein EYF80_000346 [Liparis tanakae]
MFTGEQEEMRELLGAAGGKAQQKVINSLQLTFTAFLNLRQKSWKMRKHSSSLKVSVSSQKKSMRALPSFRRSSLRLFRSCSVRDEF